jgi:tripartite-type tricarboxylate transporter receptor subunit TctC
MTYREFLKRVLLGAGACLLASAANAQSFAGKPIRIMLGFAPGGLSDMIGRVYAEKLQGLLGTPVILENRPGAFEQLAYQPVMAAAPDGHTLWLATQGSLVMMPGIRSNLPYNINTNFTHVAKLGEVYAAFVVKKDIPANTLPEFVEYAKKNSGKLNYGSAGMGSGSHLLTEYVMGLTNISMTHVPYKGDADVVREVAAGNIDFGVLTVGTAAQFVRNGSMKALVVTGAQRSKALPNVPSVAENGGVEALKGYGVYGIYALLGPAGMPPAVVKALNDAVAKVSTMPDVVQRLEAADLRAATATPAELTQYVDKEIARWREVGKTLKLE